MHAVPPVSLSRGESAATPRSRHRLQRVLASLLLSCALATPVFADAWQSISPILNPPSSRRQQGLIVDTKRDRLVMAGGENGDAGTWMLDLAQPSSWTVTGAVVPQELREVIRAAHDPVGDRMLMLGFPMTVFQLNLANPTQWVPIVTSGAIPPLRNYPAVAFDPGRNRLIVFGGLGPYSDLWVLDLTSSPAVWIQVLPSSSARPSAIWSPVGVYDPVRDRLVVTTGEGISSREVWAFSFGTNSWIQIMSSQQLNQPGQRTLSAGALDPVSRHLVLFGGYAGFGLNDVWQLSLDDPMGWTPILPTGGPPSGRWSHMMTYRPATGTMYTIGGWDLSNFRGDLWALERGGPLGPPDISGFTPKGGTVGDIVTVFGIRLAQVTKVTLSSVECPILSKDETVLTFQVAAGATTGAIILDSPAGPANTTEDFIVGEDPSFTDIQPDSARVGETVELHGAHFVGTQRVQFGGTGSAHFVEVADTMLVLTVDSLGTSGPIKVKTVVGESQSPFTFQIIADDMRPRLLSVRDVPDDQGGRVVLRWRSSDFDQTRYRRVKGYRVWRRAPLAGPPGAVRAGTLNARGAALGDPEVFWESLVDLPAASLRGYAYTAATVSDSTANGNPYTAFFVQVLTNDAFEFFASSPDSGYSVDNLSPPTPSQLTVRYNSTSNQLRWTARTVPDQAGFEVHRALRTDFTPDATTRVSLVQDSTFVDSPGAFTYKLAAVDIHGNRSRFLTVVPDRPVATLVSIASQERRPGVIEIRWYLSGNASLQAVVERRSSGQDWRPRAALAADGSGYLRFVDDGISDDETFEYRLRIEEPEGPVWLGQVTFEPLGTVTGPTVRIPNPSMGGRIAFELAGFDAHPVQVQLFDVTGRLMESQRLGAGAGASTQVAFGQARRLHAGIYLVRVSGGPTAITRRVVVLD